MAVTVTLTFLNGSLKGRRWDFKRPTKCVIGRSSDCDIQLPAGLEFLDVSRHHCELSLDPPSVEVRDLGSRNGTFLNGVNIGQRLPGQAAQEGGWHTLKEGDELRIGGAILRISVSARPARERVPVASGWGLWPLFRFWTGHALRC